jgi:hypothetical protein
MERHDPKKTLTIIREMTNPVEAIVNILYLIRYEHKNPKVVLRYVALADSQVRCLIDIVQRERIAPQ